MKESLKVKSLSVCEKERIQAKMAHEEYLDRHVVGGEL